MDDLTHRRVRQSTRDDWRTPPTIFKAIDRRFHFTGDACASAINTHASEYIDHKQDALKSCWARLGPSVWMNPPYSMAGEMVRRARQMSRKHHSQVVCLVPGTVDVRWFHEEASDAAELWFYRGRINFIDPVLETPALGNPVGSVLVVFSGERSHAGPRVGRLCARSGQPTSREDREYWERLADATQPAIFEDAEFKRKTS